MQCDALIHGLLIGSVDAEHVAIQLQWQGVLRGWLTGDVHIQVKGFVGDIRAYFEPHDFVQFAMQLTTLYEKLSGVAELRPREEQLTLQIVGNGRGGMSVNGSAYAHATWGSKLMFEFDLDQTYLPEPLSQLQALVRSLEQ